MDNISIDHPPPPRYDPVSTSTSSLDRYEPLSSRGIGESRRPYSRFERDDTYKKVLTLHCMITSHKIVASLPVECLPNMLFPLAALWTDFNWKWEVESSATWYRSGAGRPKTAAGESHTGEILSRIHFLRDFAYISSALGDTSISLVYLYWLRGGNTNNSFFNVKINRDNDNNTALLHQTGLPLSWKN